MFDVLLGKACVLVFLISVVPLVLASVAGLLVGVVQASTQIQEQIFSYLARLIVVATCLFIARDYYSHELMIFLQDSLRALEYVGGDL